jgi:hypothetical protein
MGSVETAELDTVQDTESDQEEQDDPDGGQGHERSDYLRARVDEPL